MTVADFFKRQPLFISASSYKVLAFASALKISFAAEILNSA